MRTKGFTLVEVLVALTVLTTALVPVFVLANSAVSLSARIKNSLISSALAQEGVELVRAMRDDDWFDPSQPAFGAGLVSACSAGCRVEWNRTSPLALAGNPFLQVTDDGKYQYSGGTPSIFRRMVTVTSLTDAVKVTSEVTWTDQTGPKEVAVEYYLYDWIK